MKIQHLPPIFHGVGGVTTFFDLENPEDVARLREPELTLGPLRGLVVLDEIQRRPDLFPVLRVLADRRPLPARFLVLGSVSPELLKQSAETLAGRIGYADMAGFDCEEIDPSQWKRLWVRGGFPLSFLARSETASFEWRRALVRDFLARAFGIADTTLRRHLDHPAGTFALRVLPPWHENIGKRQVKASRVYVSDSGILHALIGLGTHDALLSYAKVGSSWEGFVLEQVIRRLRARPEECFFWRTHTGAGLDLLVVRGQRRLGFEMKRTSTPSMSPSMRSASARNRARCEIPTVVSEAFCERRASARTTSHRWRTP